MEEFFEEEYDAEVLVNQTEQKMLYKFLLMMEEETSLDGLKEKVKLLVK